MSLTAQGKKMVSRSRCDSPAPRGVDASPATVKQSTAMCKDAQTSSPRVSSLASLLAIALFLGHAALHSDSEELLGNTPTWTALVIFLMVGAVLMRFDFIDAVKAETKKEGLQSLDQFPVIPVGCCWLILGCGVALFLALSTGWCQGSTQDGLTYQLFMEELHSHATNLKDASFLAIAKLLGTVLHTDSEKLLDDTPTWIALVIFLMVGTVVMYFDFIDAVKEEASKEGLQSMGQFSLIPSGCRLGCGVALALAVAHHWHIAYSDEVAILFLSAVLAIGLAATISNSPKSRFAMK